MGQGEAWLMLAGIYLDIDGFVVRPACNFPPRLNRYPSLSLRRSRKAARATVVAR